MTTPATPKNFPAGPMVDLRDLDVGDDRLVAGYLGGDFRIGLRSGDAIFPPRAVSALLQVLTRQRLCLRPTNTGAGTESGYKTTPVAYPCARCIGHTGTCTFDVATAHRFDEWFCGALTPISSVACTVTDLLLPCLRGAGHADGAHGGHTYDEPTAKEWDDNPASASATVKPPATSALEDRLAALEASVGELAEVVLSMQTISGELQEIVARPPAAAPPLPGNLATTDYVAQELYRLSQALHEHVARVAREILQVAVPTPGRIRRALQSLISPPTQRVPWPFERSPAEMGTPSGSTPSAAARAGARAAAGVSSKGP